MPPIPALTSRRPETWLLAASLLCGCGLSVYGGATETSSTTGSSTGDSTGAATSGSTSTGIDPTGGTTGTTTTGTTTVSTGGTTTTGTTTGGGTTTTGDASTGDASTGSSSTGVVPPDKMETWGHACSSDDECMAIVGEKGVCLQDVLGLYGLPGGYCTKGCQLPDLMTMYVPDHPTCGPDVYCVGVMGYFEACLVECFDDGECPREGYECRTLPEVGQPGDPMFCLMTDDNKL